MANFTTTPTVAVSPLPMYLQTETFVLAVAVDDVFTIYRDPQTMKCVIRHRSHTLTLHCISSSTQATADVLSPRVADDLTNEIAQLLLTYLGQAMAGRWTCTVPIYHHIPTIVAALQEQVRQYTLTDSNRAQRRVAVDGDSPQNNAAAAETSLVGLDHLTICRMVMAVMRGAAAPPAATNASPFSFPEATRRYHERAAAAVFPASDGMVSH